MTMEMLATLWMEYVENLNGAMITKEDINDFCNLNATSYEEYMYIWELLECSIEDD